MAVLGLRLCARALSSCGKRGPLFIAVRGPLTIAASPVAEHRFQRRRLSNHGPRAQPLCGMRDPPSPGPEPVSPALAGGLSTTAPPGKPPSLIYWSSFSDSPRPFYKLLQTLQSPSCVIIFTHMVPSTWNILPYVTHLGNFYSSFRSQLKCHFLKEVFLEIPNQVRFYILTTLILFLHNIYYNCIHIISLLLICSIFVFP